MLKEFESDQSKKNEELTITTVAGPIEKISDETQNIEKNEAAWVRTVSKNAKHIYVSCKPN